MAVIVSMLRGVNLVSHNRIKMDALRALYGSLGLRDAQTYVVSGNVVFRTKARNLTRWRSELKTRSSGVSVFAPGSSFAPLRNFKTWLRETRSESGAASSPANCW